VESSPEQSGSHAESAAPACDFQPEKLLLKLKVTLVADQQAVDPVVQGVMGIVRQMQCAPGKEDDIELALAEALANAVVHGCKCDTEKVIECCVACDENRGMLIIVRDPGPGFDPAALPSPVVGQNLYSNHGRGIFLINQLMDEVKFMNNGTEIHMVKR
jgi:serine/threonine-protein kinase RsbW